MANILHLSVGKRIQLAEDIGDSLVGVPELVTLTEAHREELDRRLEDYHLHPDEGSPWETVKSRILGQP